MNQFLIEINTLLLAKLQNHQGLLLFLIKHFKRQVFLFLMQRLM